MSDLFDERGDVIKVFVQKDEPEKEKEIEIDENKRQLDYIEIKQTPKELKNYLKF